MAKSTDRKAKNSKNAQSGADASPLQLLLAEGESILELGPDSAALFRRWYTLLSRERPFPTRFGLTSALTGEGVTTAALSLSAMMAYDLDSRLCLVEMNWWRPGLATRAKIDANPGLAQALSGEAPLDDCIRSTSLPNLWLLPAGDLTADSRTRQARSAGLPGLIDQLQSRFDHVLFDLPALLAVGDAATLAALAGSLCLVVRQGATPLPLVRQALDEVAHLPVSGVVYNGNRVAMPGWLLRLIPGG